MTEAGLFLTDWFAIQLFDLLARRVPLPTEPWARVVLKLALALLISSAARVLVTSHVQGYRKGLPRRRRPRPAGAASVPPAAPAPSNPAGGPT